mgnify:FL=1|jgi:sugar phosphate isomerase/epimerase
MNLQIGLQLFSVRNELMKSPERTFERISGIGYENLELFIHDASNGVRFCGLSAKELKRLLDANNLRIVSSHVGILGSVDWDELIEYNREIGSSAIVCPMELGIADPYAFCEKMNRYGEICRSYGMDFCYHNHFEVYQRFGDKTLLEILLERTDKDLVKIEFDTYWALRGGGDPVAWLERLGDRCDLVHQKDIPASVQPVNVFETISDREPITMESFMPFAKPENFTEIGCGVMDIRGILDTLKKIGAARYLFVEQDLTTIGELESIARSYHNITALLAETEGAGA